MLGIAKAAALAATLVGAVGAMGGWAVVSVENLPASLEAGGQYRLEFTVRQHGVEPLAGLKPRVRLEGTSTSVAAEPTRQEGRYAAVIPVPDAQRVTMVIETGWGRGRQAELTLLPIAVAARGAAQPAVSTADRGRQLFVARGCATCHLNGDLPEQARVNVSHKLGPELTGRRLEASYVRQRVTRPLSLPAIGGTGMRMPDLGVPEPEVEALVAFLSGPRETATN